MIIFLNEHALLSARSAVFISTLLTNNQVYGAISKLLKAYRSVGPMFNEVYDNIESLYMLLTLKVLLYIITAFAAQKSSLTTIFHTKLFILETL